MKQLVLRIIRLEVLQLKSKNNDMKVVEKSAMNLNTPEKVKVKTDVEEKLLKKSGEKKQNYF